MYSIHHSFQLVDSDVVEMWMPLAADRLLCSPGRPVYFTGEMVFPWMFEDFDELVPLRETADMIANIDDWPSLYDIDNLKCNTVPASTIMCCEVGPLGN